MSSATPTAPKSSSTPEEVAARCVAIFRDLHRISDRPEHFGITDEAVATTPIEEFALDSLAVMELVMAIENEFDVSLDEDEVTSCATLGELAALTHKEMNV